MYFEITTTVCCLYVGGGGGGGNGGTEERTMSFSDANVINRTRIDHLTETNRRPR